MRVQDIMTPDPACCTRYASLTDVARMMRDHDCGAIPVVEDNSRKLIGILSDRDIVIRSLGQGRNPLYALSAWRETPFFTDRERAALAWTEAVTEVAHGHVPDEVYELARRHFGEKDLVDLTLVVVAINGWNRLAISFRKVPGTYQPTHHGDRSD